MSRAFGRGGALKPAIVLVDSDGGGDSFPGLSAEFSAMPMEFATAHNLLTRGEVGPGSRVLIIVADEASGYACMRLAAHKRADVTAHCEIRHAASARAAGAGVIPAGHALPSCAFDAVIDLASGEEWRTRLFCLRPGGRYVTRGAIADAENATVFLNDLPLFDTSRQPREVFPGLITVVRASPIRAVPDNCLSFRSTTNV
jgi:NADPH:quinone reductase-like Zn-dependent oxidoreductase